MDGTTPGDSTPTAPSSRDSLVITDPSNTSDHTLSSENESESDLEPEKLVEKYLGLKKQLYKISPELLETNKKKQGTAKTGTFNLSAGRSHGLGQRIARLTAKLNRIKADILFDEGEAEHRWAESRVIVAKELAERKRLGFRDENIPKKQAAVADSPNQNEGPDQDDGDPDMLGNLFTNLSSCETNEVQDVDTNAPEEAAKSIVTIRDFGKWTGVHPRRILEEGCKSK